MALKPRTPTERVDLSIQTIQDSNWFGFDGVAAFRRNTRLFVGGDVVFCDINNGQGERCLVCGWSSKRGPLGRRRSRVIYASHTRTGCQNPKTHCWTEHRDRTPLVWLMPPGELLAMGTLPIDPEVRAYVLGRYVQRFPRVGKYG